MSHRLGCVSYLNTKPLIAGLEDDPRFDLRFAVPAQLPRMLLEKEVNLALCPVFDLFANRDLLEMVPVGGIASDGETLTVKLFSRVPLAQIRTVAADPDSHASVNLLRVLWRWRHGLTPALRPITEASDTDAVLLIGDKVITRAPKATTFPWTLDLGAAWKEATGLPFVFAVWMKRIGEDLGELPALLAAQRLANDARRAAIADRYGPELGWPAGALARRYLADILRFDIGPREQAAITQFGLELAALDGSCQGTTP